VAEFFGTTRTPLSGGNSGHTRSDTLHDRLFIETKHRVVHQVRTLHDSTKIMAKKENKIPLLCLIDKGRPGFLIVVHSDDLGPFRGVMLDMDVERALAGVTGVEVTIEEMK
jgi:hypothetical protein